MKQRVLRAAGVALVMIGLTGQPAFAAEWFQGNGKSCDQVCKAQGMSPIASGIHTPGGKATQDQFFVCAADKNGWRGGYNLKPKWADVCMVGYGGKEIRATPYLCACE
jgi:hypothetical protein